MSYATPYNTEDDDSSTDPLPLDVIVVIQLAIAHSQPCVMRFYPTGFATSLISQALSREELLVKCIFCGKDRVHNPEGWKITPNWSSTHSQDEILSKALDDTASAVGENGQLSFLELTSPMLPMIRRSNRASDVLCTTRGHHSLSWKATISSVINRLEQELGSPKTDGNGITSFLYAQKSAVLKTVIVANSGFGLRTLRNVAVMTQACARQLDTLQNLTRIDQSSTSSDEMRCDFAAADCSTSHIEVAEQACTTHDVDLLITELALSEHPTALSRSLERFNSYAPVITNMHHITFTQHASTLDSNKVLCWIDVVSKIVQRSRTLPQDEFFRNSVPTGDWRQADFTTKKFLKMLQCKSSTIQHYMREGPGGNARRAAEEKKLELAERVLWDEAPLGEFAVKVADEMIEDEDMSNVEEVVMAKLKGEKYGQFDEEFIKAVEKAGL